MDHVQIRLVKCFQAVFPALPEDAILQCTQATNSAWDSIAAITLANVIEEEFGFQMDLEVLPELDSFDRVLSYVNTQKLA
jgi:acyl carrier protein